MIISEVPLKPELWVNIFEALKDSSWLCWAKHENDQVVDLFKVQIKEICLTCRVFSEIAQPFLFEDLDFNGENPDTLLGNVQQLRSLFDAKPGSSNWVKTLNVALRDNHSGESPSPSLLEAASIISDDLFLRMNSLRLINIQHTIISSGMYAQLYRLPKLRSLQLWNISFLDNPVTRDVHVGDLTLRSVIFNDLHTSEAYVKSAAARLAFSPMIETLHLSPTITPTVFNLGPSLGVEILERLRSLSMTEPSGSLLKDFFSFTRLSPNLDTLQTLSNHNVEISYSSPTSIHVPQDILPNLRTLRCSPPLAEALVHGRSITDLTCETPTNSGQPIGSIERIAGNTHGLQSLTLHWAEWSEDLFRIISSATPGLERLSLWITDDEYMTWLSLNLVKAVQPFKKLRQLSCFGKGHPRAIERISTNSWQLQALTILAESNPALTNVTFNLMIEWNRSPDGIWRRGRVDQGD